MTATWNAKNQQRRELVAKWAARRKEQKDIILSISSSTEEKEAAVDALNKMPKNSSKIRIRNRCQLTGRARGGLTKFKLSRITFREIHAALIPGVIKASW
jgi:small subunit ribosomal protein S14